MTKINMASETVKPTTAPAMPAGADHKPAVVPAAAPAVETPAKM